MARFTYMVLGVLLFSILLLACHAQEPTLAQPPTATATLHPDLAGFDPRDLTATAQQPTPAPTATRTVEAEMALDYVAQRYHIPRENLYLAEAEPATFQELGRNFVIFDILDSKDNWQPYVVLVDLADHSITEDYLALQEAETDAKYTRYGKRGPELVEYLAALEPGEPVTLAIWVVGNPLADEERLHAALIEKFPEVGRALAESGNPFAVNNRELSQQIRAEYIKLLEIEGQRLVEPLVTDLRKMGYEPILTPGIPTVLVTVPQMMVPILEARPDVASLMLGVIEIQPESDSALPSNRAPAVWQKGFQGDGVKIAILEPGKVKFEAQHFV